MDPEDNSSQTEQQPQISTGERNQPNIARLSSVLKDFSLDFGEQLSLLRNMGKKPNKQPKEAVPVRIKLEVPENQQLLHRVFIFELDNTLLQTTNVQLRHGYELDQDQIHMRQHVDKSVMKILQTCLEYGQVSIVTNSTREWALYSCRQYLPLTFLFLQEAEVQVVSAMEMFCKIHPRKKWKAQTVRQLLDQMPVQVEGRQPKVELIFIGGHEEQIENACRVAFKIKRAIVKRVYGRQRPAFNQLRRFLQRLGNSLQRLITEQTSLILRIRE